jgi:hypothetical protein
MLEVALLSRELSPHFFIFYLEKHVHFENKNSEKAHIFTFYIAMYGTVKTPKLQWWLFFYKKEETVVVFLNLFYCDLD